MIGVSRDSIKSHENFYKKYKLKINLVSDESEKLCSLFDVMRKKTIYGNVVNVVERSTFFIDSTFFLKKSWRNVKAKGHAEEVLKEINFYNKSWL